MADGHVHVTVPEPALASWGLVENELRKFFS